MSDSVVDDDQYCIALQPVCDALFQHIGDELLYRASPQANNAEIDDPLLATARACSAAIYDIGLEKLVGNRWLFLNVSSEWLARPELLPMPAEQIIIEITDTVPADSDTVRAIQLIKARGYRVSWTLQGDHDRARTLGVLADIIKVDTTQPYDEKAVEALASGKRTFLAEKVDDLAVFERYKALGFTLFQGYFFAQPKTHTSSLNTRRGNQSIQLKLITELYRDTVNLDDIAKLIAQDPYLYVTVLKRANSGYFGQGKQITQLKRSLQLLGLIELRTLVATVMLSQNGPVCRLTMKLALTRALMCRLLADPFPGIDRESAFTAGLFSLMDVMLDLPMETLLREVPLPDDVLAALRSRSGSLGALLILAEDYEKMAVDGSDATERAELRRCYLQANEEADALLRSLKTAD
ncbi:diguanylate phosphodiesterase [Modicisalibacter xianhensis]|uniref:Diguanylate phosphodiesterase n=1 Tax=Modicisalibacter xianhensis TaxID=442341 RepID=A0A4R8FVY8_9GAMM|nr:HDOD domain-containing protein [Halomonas xianhensis]TDX31028.1 diguanylate phosphodiesterase [Halomonas xianhensis]